jgi:hypothetical protein
MPLLRKEPDEVMTRFLASGWRQTSLLRRKKGALGSGFHEAALTASAVTARGVKELL